MEQQTDIEKSEEEEIEVITPEIIERLIPPVYSRQLKLFGLVVWSDTRHLDEDAIYSRIAERVNRDLAKQAITLQATQGR